MQLGIDAVSKSDYEKNGIVRIYFATLLLTKNRNGILEGLKRRCFSGSPCITKGSILLIIKECHFAPIYAPIQTNPNYLELI